MYLTSQHESLSGSVPRQETETGLLARILTGFKGVLTSKNSARRSAAAPSLSPPPKPVFDIDLGTIWSILFFF